jgi:hypothetical protein
VTVAVVVYFGLIIEIPPFKCQPGMNMESDIYIYIYSLIRT